MSGLGGANGAYGFKWAGLDKGFILGFFVDWAGSIKGCVDLFIYFKLRLRVWVKSWACGLVNKMGRSRACVHNEYVILTGSGSLMGFNRKAEGARVFLIKKKKKNLTMGKKKSAHPKLTLSSHIRFVI